MNYQGPQLLDELAAQYALGTLRGSARQRFERLCRSEPAALIALHRWEDRLVGLMTEIKPVQPPQAVWQKVRQRLGHGGHEERDGVFGKLFGWWSRSQLAMAVGLAAIALTIAVVTYVSIPQSQLLATIANEQQTALWRVEAVKDRAKLVVTRSANAALDPNRDYELWALLDSGAAPVSLGLLPKNGARDLQLSAAQPLALGGASKIAVSLEPIGGSPTGAPTGPVLFVATITRA
jgi:anti-sigma-K factor RskA